MIASPVPRCAWTHQSTSDLKRIQVAGVDRFGRPAAEQTLYVKPEHEAELRYFLSRVQRYGSLFLCLMLLFSVAAVVLAIMGTLVGVVVVLLLLGTTLVVLPFATTETLALVGVRAAVMLARGAGLAAIAFGLLLLLRS